MHHPPPGTDALLRRIGDRVRTARERAGLSQERLAHAAGLAPRTIVAIESGRHNATVTSLHALATVLDVPVAALVAEEGPRP